MRIARTRTLCVWSDRKDKGRAFLALAEPRMEERLLSVMRLCALGDYMRMPRWRRSVNGICCSESTSTAACICTAALGMP